MRGGKEIQQRLNVILHIAPELSVNERCRILELSHADFDKWRKKRKVRIVRPHEENPILRGAEIRCPLNDYFALKEIASEIDFEEVYGTLRKRQ